MFSHLLGFLYPASHGDSSALLWATRGRSTERFSLRFAHGHRHSSSLAAGHLPGSFHAGFIEIQFICPETLLVKADSSVVPVHSRAGDRPVSPEYVHHPQGHLRCIPTLSPHSGTSACRPQPPPTAHVRPRLQIVFWAFHRGGHVCVVLGLAAATWLPAVQGHPRWSSCGPLLPWLTAIPQQGYTACCPHSSAALALRLWETMLL